MEVVGNANTLVNMVSRRVRQLNAGGGGSSRPMIADTVGLGAADIALLEIIEGKMEWSIREAEEVRPKGSKGIRMEGKSMRASRH